MYIGRVGRKKRLTQGAGPLCLADVIDLADSLAWPMGPGYGVGNSDAGRVKVRFAAR
jgi:hypothetical protein